LGRSSISSAPRRCSSLLTCTTRGAFAARSDGNSCAVSAKCPRWFVPSCISKPSFVSRSGSAITPALLTRTSRRGHSARIRRDASRTLARSARSSGTHATSFAPAARSFSAASAILASSRQASTTRAPLAPSMRAASKPIPLFAPVTTKERPARSGMSETSNDIGSYDATSPARVAR